MAIVDYGLAKIVGEYHVDGNTKTYHYWIEGEASDDEDSIHEAAAASSFLPVEGDGLGDSTGLIALRVSIEQDDQSSNTRRFFHYIVEFGTPPDADFVENPLSRPAEIEADGASIEEVVFKDSLNQEYRNSAGNLYSGIPPRRVLGGSIVITRNESSNPLNNVFAYSGSVNTDAWHGVAAEKAMFGNIRARKIFHPNYGAYWEVVYPIFLNRNGWRIKVPDMGTQKLLGGVAVDILDSNGSKVSEPVPLDGSGGVLSPGSPLVYFPTDGFLPPDKTTWASLSLPNPFA